MSLFTRAIVTIPMLSQNPDDAVTNTWYFDGESAAVTRDDHGLTVVTLLTGFYQQIDGSLFPNSVGSPATVDLYDMADSTPRVPYRTSTIPLTNGGANSLPSEVALVLSFKGDFESGTPNARRRGRVYIGPLGTDIITVGGTAPSRPNAATRDTLRDAAELLRTSSTDEARWAVFSQATLTETSSLEQAFHDVVGGWVDDAWDTQRRRGISATTRDTFGDQG